MPYTEAELPSGFSYPDLYLKLSNQGELLANSHWWFPSHDYGVAQNAWNVRLYWVENGWKLLDQIDPIPFARNGDLAAFFDGADLSGDPRIVVVDYGDKTESRFFINFAEWLKFVTRD